MQLEMEDDAMSLIRNGYVASTRRGFLGGLFSAIIGRQIVGCVGPELDEFVQ